MSAFGQEERDLLIGVSINVENISIIQGKMEKKLDAHILKESEFITKKAGMWVTGSLTTLIVALIFGSFAYTYNIDSVHDLHSKNFGIHRTIAIMVPQK